MPRHDEALEPLRLVHHHPGRLRMRADRFLDDASVPAVRRALEPLRAVLGVEHNAFTGSLLIEYAVGEIEPDAILGAVVAAAGLGAVIDEALSPARQNPALHVIAAARRLDALVREGTRGRADLRLLVPVALATLGGVQLLRSPVMPRWDNLLYWSWAIFRDLHEREIDEGK